jgi:hypothetical protein
MGRWADLHRIQPPAWCLAHIPDNAVPDLVRHCRIYPNSCYICTHLDSTHIANVLIGPSRFYGLVTSSCSLQTRAALSDSSTPASTEPEQFTRWRERNPPHATSHTWLKPADFVNQAPSRSGVTSTPAVASVHSAWGRPHFSTTRRYATILPSKYAFV